MTIFKYTKAQLYRLDQTCKLMLAAEDWQRLKDLSIRAVHGCRAGKKETKQQSTSHIPTRVTQRPSADRVHKGRQHGRGVYKHVATVDSLTSTVSSRTLAAITCKHRSAIKTCLLNPCSVCNKTSVLQELVTDHNIDLMVLTETWLKGDDRDTVILAKLQPPGYSIKHKARQGRGGGVAIMHPSTLSVTRAEHSVSSPPQYASFEELQCLEHTVPAVRLAVIYRPPPSKTNGLNYKTFYAEIGNYIKQLVLTPGALVIAGDFNIHVDDHSDKEAADFLSLIESFCLKQHVCGPTHRTGQTLDLVPTRDRDSLAPTVSSQYHCFPDHFTVFCDLSLTTEYSRLHEVTYRKITAINADCFIHDVSASVLCSTSATTLTLMWPYTTLPCQPLSTCMTLMLMWPYTTLPCQPMSTCMPLKRHEGFQRARNLDGTTRTSAWRSSLADTQRDCGGRHASQYTTTCSERNAGWSALRSRKLRNTTA